MELLLIRSATEETSAAQSEQHADITTTITRQKWPLSMGCADFAV
jgi:hypothetical protein